jgi:hypothetical protein
MGLRLGTPVAFLQAMATHTVTLLIPASGRSAAARPPLAGMLVKRADGRVMFSAVDARLARASLTAASLDENARRFR